MLIVSRKKNESIVINDDISMVVLDIQGDKVRLGISSSHDWPVHTTEVYDAIRRSEPDPPRSTAIVIPENGVTALATIRSQIGSQQDDGTLIATILEAVAAKGTTAADFDNFKKTT